MKTCTKCGVAKPLEAFYCGVAAECHACVTTAWRARWSVERARHVGPLERAAESLRTKVRS